VSDHQIAVLARQTVLLRLAYKRGAIDEASVAEAELAMIEAVLAERLTSPCPICGAERGYTEGPNGEVVTRRDGVAILNE
jgi:hypothetical protein